MIRMSIRKQPAKSRRIVATTGLNRKFAEKYVSKRQKVEKRRIFEEGLAEKYVSNREIVEKRRIFEEELAEKYVSNRENLGMGCTFNYKWPLLYYY